MKLKVHYLIIMVFLGISSVKAQLNVGSTSAADASAILQATSTTKGFLPPVMTTTQINAIVSPANGLTVYNSTLSQLQVNVGTPAVPSWSVAAGGANVYWSQLGNTGTVPGTNYVGTTDNNSLGFRTNGVERVRIDSATGNVGIGTTTPQAPLQFANAIANRTIVLWDNNPHSAGNDSSYYGFGINSSALRYNVPTGGSHSFYSNKTMVANIDPLGRVYFQGSSPAVFFNDQARSNRQGAIYSHDGKVALYGSQNGDLLTVDSLGNTVVKGQLNVVNLPTTTSTSTQLLTTDASGNVGKTTLSVIQPTIFAASGQNGVTSIYIPTSTGFSYSGYTVTLPANTKYLFRIHLLMGYSGTWTAGGSQYVYGQFSTTQPTFTGANGAGYGYGNPVMVGALANTDRPFQFLAGGIAVQNTTAAPLTLYFFVASNSPNGYTGGVFINSNNGENMFIGTPIN